MCNSVSVCLVSAVSGEVYMWGYGKACHGNSARDILQPEKLTLPSPVHQLAAGSTHCLLVTGKISLNNMHLQSNPEGGELLLMMLVHPAVRPASDSTVGRAFNSGAVDPGSNLGQVAPRELSLSRFAFSIQGEMQRLVHPYQYYDLGGAACLPSVGHFYHRHMAEKLFSLTVNPKHSLTLLCAELCWKIILLSSWT